MCLTPFEKNLEMWRQLWRVVERSDVVVQVLDCRNPLLFRCPDFEQFVREVDPIKRNVLLLNKADLLSLNMRKAWADYLQSAGIRFMFWSALLQNQENERAQAEEKAARLRKDANFLIDQQIKQLRKDLTQQAANAAVVAAQELLQERTTETDQDRLAEAYLTRLDEVLEERQS